MSAAERAAIVGIETGLMHARKLSHNLRLCAACLVASTGALARPLRVSGSPPAVEPQKTSAELFEAGRARLKAGQAPEAIELLSAAIARRPGEIEYQLTLSKAYDAAGRRDAAIRLLENIVKRHERHVVARVSLARLHALGGAPARVRELLTPFPDELDAAALLLLANASRDLGRHSDSRHSLRAGISRFPRDAPLWLALIDSMIEEERHAGALAVIRKAEQRLGRSAALHYRAARSYFALDELLGEASARAVRGGRVGQFHDDLLLVERRSGTSRFLCCPPRSALYQLRRALDAGMDAPEAHLMHAEIWRRIGKPRIGFGIVKRRESVLLQDPDASTLRAFARLALESESFSDYLRYVRALAALDANRGAELLRTAFETLAERYNERGDDAMQVRCLERAAALSPDDPALLLRLGDAKWQHGELRAAATCFQRVLELAPAHPQRRRILARLADLDAPRGESP